jgi:hypothetical protein
MQHKSILALAIRRLLLRIGNLINSLAVETAAIQTKSACADSNKKVLKSEFRIDCKLRIRNCLYSFTPD